MGLAEVLFQSLTFISPGTSLALVLPFVVVFAGGALPLVVIFIFIGCFSTAWLLGEMASKLPSSGGMLTFIANGLGSNVGFVAGWAYLMCLLADVAGIYLLLAGFVANQLNASWHWNTTAVWVVVTIALAGFVTFNGLRRANRGTRLGAILGTIEVLVFAILVDLAHLRGRRPEHAAGIHHALRQRARLPRVLRHHRGRGPHDPGLPGLRERGRARRGGQAAQDLGEGGMLFSVGGILLYFILATYASTVYFGPAKMAGGFATYGGGAPWDQLARDVWGVGWVIVFLAIVNSVTACANACNIATTRTLFAMSRAGVLPDQLAAINRHKVPGPAQWLTTAVAFVAAIITAAIWGPGVAATFLLTITSGIIIVLYIVVAIACVTFFWRRYRSEFGWLKHGLPALLVVVCFVPAFLATFGIKAFRFVTPLAWPEKLIAPIVIAWVVIGIGVAVYLIRTRERGVSGVRDLYAEAEPAGVGERVAGPRQQVLMAVNLTQRIRPCARPRSRA